VTTSNLRVLYIAYPLLPVTEHSAGGAEQVLWTLERAVHGSGQTTVVAASEGSQISGELFVTGAAPEELDQIELRAAEQTRRILDWLLSGAVADFNIIHDMSGGFWQHAAHVDIPVLATLHLPRSLYTGVDFSNVPQQVAFNCVSQSQMNEFRDLPRLTRAVQNGIALDRFESTPLPQDAREYFLWLGRICEEKGTHTALDVAHAARAKLIIAGAVYPFLYHQKYFAREVIPRLKRAGSQAKYIERPAFAEKVDLLRNARALLITSDISETSSIVAMEAAACGTPVVALRRGALADVVADGITGILVNGAEEMIAALPRVHGIDPAKCREYAEQHYPAEQMTCSYNDLYRKLIREFQSQARHQNSAIV
jgi:glycosyltransferase involved in cell wall biosynthesis